MTAFAYRVWVELCMEKRELKHGGTVQAGIRRSAGAGSDLRHACHGETGQLMPATAVGTGKSVVR